MFFSAPGSAKQSSKIAKADSVASDTPWSLLSDDEHGVG